MATDLKTLAPSEAHYFNRYVHADVREFEDKLLLIFLIVTTTMVCTYSVPLILVSLS
jgi:hypothetical protein